MSKIPSLRWSDSKRWGLPLILVVVALALRMIGIGWGLPNDKHHETFHPDESVVWAYSQAIEPTKLQFTPGFYNYGTLYLTTLKIASDVVAGYSGGGVDPKDPDRTWRFIGKAHLAGRILSALAGTATVLFVFLILRRLTTEFGATCGALLIAFAPAHVVHSKFQTVDILAAFFLVVSSYFALRIIRREGYPDRLSDLRLAVLSGAFAGLSAGTKYTGILCLLTLYAVAFSVLGKAGWKACLAATVAALVVFVLTTPGVILDNAVFMKDFIYEMKHTSQGHGLIFEGTTSGFIFHIGNLLFGVGTILTILAICGLGIGAARRHLWAIGLLAFFIPYYLLIGRAEVKFIRYTFPLYLALGVGFGYVMGRAREKAGNWHTLVGVGLFGLGGFLGGGLQSTGRYLTWTVAPDPREQAGDYLQGQRVSVGVPTDPWFYTPSFHPDLGRRLFVPPELPSAIIGQYKVFSRSISALSEPAIIRYLPSNALGEIDIDSRVDWDQRLIDEAKPDYIAYSTFEVEGLDRIRQSASSSPEAKSIADNARKFIDRLRKEYEFDRQYGVGQDLIHDMMYIQPTVWIWKRKTAR